MRLIAAILLAAGLALPLRADLLLHLPFDGDAKDLSGHGRHAQANGDAALDPHSFQLGGGSAAFSGASTGFFHVPLYTPVIGNAPRTVSLWLRSARPQDRNPNAILVGWGDGGIMPGARFDIGFGMGDPTQLRAEFHSGRYVVSSTNAVPALRDDQWHHLLVAYDGTQLAFYVDGRLVEEPLRIETNLVTGLSVVGTVIGTGVREAVGTSTFNRSFDGQIDDVAIWDTAAMETEARLLNGLGRLGDNDARLWLVKAVALWQRPVGASARINGWTWRKVAKLSGQPGDFVQVGGPNGAGSYVVLDAFGHGLQLQPQWWDYRVFQVSGLALAGLVFLGAGVWVADRLRMQVRLRRLEAKERAERERRRIAQDLHDDLGSGLTEIMLLGDLAEAENLSPDDLRRRLAGVTSKTRDLVAAVDEIVWTANPVNDVLPRLADYLTDHAQRFLGAKGIACRVDIMEGLPAIPVSARIRHHLLLAMKEALNNVVKHSAASEAWLRIRLDSQELHIVVEDNGRGFDPATVKEGDGLASLRGRLTEVGGTTDILSAPGKGTTISFRLTLNSPPD